MPGVDLITAADQVHWTQRIRKENATCRVVRAPFNVRACISSTDVPVRFKPLHLVPLQPVAPPTSETDVAMRLEIDALLTARRTCRREQQPWPETMQQDVGWLQGPSGALGSPRPAGMNAGLSPRVGIGWHNPAADATKRRFLGLPPLATPREAETEVEKPSMAGYVNDDERRHHTLEAAAEKTRRNLNKHNDNPWYWPKEKSDVVEFGDRYAKAFGGGLFAKSSQKGA